MRLTTISALLRRTPAAAVLTAMMLSACAGIGGEGGRGADSGGSPRDFKPASAEVEAAPVSAVEWVTIPGGGFIMDGAGKGLKKTPGALVDVETFELARTEVTFGQYRACAKAGACEPSHEADGLCLFYDGKKWKKGKLSKRFRSDDHPVVCLYWRQAKDYSEWVGGRLPTEAEWEYAALNAGKSRGYPWSDEEEGCSRTLMNASGKGCAKIVTRPVCSGLKGGTEQGLCDITGNSWEWVWESSPGSPEGNNKYSWLHKAGGFLAPNRADFVHDDLVFYLGFRPARSLEP